MHVTSALFQDSTANALKATVDTITTANYNMTVTLRHEMAAGTTSATTFKVRIGGNSNAQYTYFLQNGGGAFFSTVDTALLTITEIIP